MDEPNAPGLAGLLVFGALPAPTMADDHNDDDNGSPKAVPFVFIGQAGDCGTDYPAGSRIVTSAWLGGMGLPDNGGPNFNLVDPRDAPNKGNPHLGLLLSKNGRSEICSASGARITGVRGLELDLTSALGFDYRKGGHCGAGAPRFNVVVQNSVTNTQTFHFVGGCSNAVPTPALQDPAEWAQVRFLTANPGQAFPPIPPGSTVVSITLIYDEGTENPTAEDPNGVGLAVVDNIFIAGALTTSGSGIATGPEPEDEDFDDDGANNDVDEDDDNDGTWDAVDTDADGDGVEDALALQFTVPRLPRSLQ